MGTFAELSELRGRLDRMVDELVDGGEHTWRLAIDVERQNGNLVVRAERAVRCANPVMVRAEPLGVA